MFFCLIAKNRIFTTPNIYVISWELWYRFCPPKITFSFVSNSGVGHSKADWVFCRGNCTRLLSWNIQIRKYEPLKRTAALPGQPCRVATIWENSSNEQGELTNPLIRTHYSGKRNGRSVNLDEALNCISDFYPKSFACYEYFLKNYIFLEIF